MKLLHMQNRAGASGTGAASGEAQPGELPHVWATEGNLAHALHVIHDECVGDPVSTLHARQGEQPKPHVSVVLAPQTAFYRRYTEGMLRRYAVLSFESGRVPSLLGREMFRGKVTSYRVHAFDDVVIFVHDVEKCVQALTSDQQQLILRIGVQEYTFGEVAARLSISIRSVQRRYAEALDELTTIFLERRLLERIASDPCQVGERSAKLISHCPA